MLSVCAMRHGLFDSVWAKPTLYLSFCFSFGSSCAEAVTPKPIAATPAASARNVLLSMISSWVNGCFCGHLAPNSALANFISQAIIAFAASDHERSMSKSDKAGGDRRGRQAGRRSTKTGVGRLGGGSQSSVPPVLKHLAGGRISELTRGR